MKQKSDRRQPRHGFGLWYYVCMCVPFVLFGAYLLIGTLEPADPSAGTPLPPSTFEPIGFKTTIENLLKNPPSKEGNAAEIYEMLAKSIDEAVSYDLVIFGRFWRLPSLFATGYGQLPEGATVSIPPQWRRFSEGRVLSTEDDELLVQAAQIRECVFSGESPWKSKHCYATIQEALVRQAIRCEIAWETEKAIALYEAELALNYRLASELSRPSYEEFLLRQALDLTRGVLPEDSGIAGKWRQFPLDAFLYDDHRLLYNSTRTVLEGLSRCYANAEDSVRSSLYAREAQEVKNALDKIGSLAITIRKSQYVASEVLLRHADPRFRIDAVGALASHAEKNVRWVFDIVPYPNAAQQRLALQVLREAAEKETNPQVLEAINDVLGDYAARAAR